MYCYKDLRRILKGDASDRYNVDSDGRLRVAAAIGTDEPDTLDRMEELKKEGVDAVVIDTAHGYSEPVFKILKIIRSKREYDEIDVVAGNITTCEAAEDLVRNGADALKVGQGGGSICSTRIISGVGYPQLSAVWNCAQEVKNTRIPIIADGAIVNSGDIPKAIAAGASSVMCGNLFAGCDQTPGETFFADGMTWKSYRGMGSEGALKESASCRQRYNQNGNHGALIPEGVEARVPARGSVYEVIQMLLGGLRSGMGYVGAGDMKTLSKAEFVKITAAAGRESHAHDVTLTRQPPNYAIRM